MNKSIRAPISLAIIILVGATVFGISYRATGGQHGGGSFAEESFSEDDFAQFFSLIEDGKIAADKIEERCATQGIGFTFLGRNVEHQGSRQRIFYNVSGEDTAVDGRTLRAKHFNASFGEWTGSVFKPLCPGMYTIAVDYAADPGTELALYLRRAGEERPGQQVLNTTTGRLTLALPLRSMDEVSTWTSGAGKRALQQVAITVVKVQHLPDYVADIDMDQFTEDIALLKRTARD